MKKLITIICILLTIALTTSAQSATRITGMLKDAAGAAIINANISVLLATDSSLVKADVSDVDGHFDIVLPNGGSYLIRYNMMGYETRYKGPFTVKNNEAFSAPAATLTVAAAELKAVSVTSKKQLIEVKADKVVFNVENSINATGSNVLELLRKSPGVTVDNNENIAMRGKTGVRIYIDGKMSQLNAADLAAYLKSINSSDVEAIEMISNPGARYDASGNAGIINIRLRKNKKLGTNGSANLNFIEGLMPKSNGSVNLNYRNQKINVFGNLGGNLGRNENGLNLDRYQNDTAYIQRSVTKTNERGMNLKAGIDYFMTSKQTIGFLLTTNIGDNERKSVSGTNIIDDNGNGAFVKRLDALNDIPGSRTNNNINFNYRYADTSGRELNVDADYGLFRGRGQSTQPNYYVDNNNNPIYTIINANNTPTDINIYTIKADWEQKLGKGKLGFGGKVSYVATDNAFDFYNVDTITGQQTEIASQSNTFKYTENVNAAYVSYARQFSEKISLQTGLRVENTISRGELTRADGIQQPDDTVARNYTDLFPSAALTWNANKTNSFNLTYSRRIDRPSYQDLNPFENKLDELTYEKGNAFLKPQYTNIVELTHTLMGFINSTISYSHVHDYATQVTDTTGNASYVQQRNLATQNIFSLTIGAPTNIKKWWTGYANVSYTYQVFDGMIGANKVNAIIPSYNFYLMQSFSLGKNYSAEISGWYSGPSVWGVTWHTQPQGGLDLGVQKQFWDKNATIKISATDIFHTEPWKATSDFGGMLVHGSGYWDSQTARLSFTWRFGSNQISSARERHTGLESESSRIKK